MATEQAMKLARWILDYEEPNGITPALEIVIGDQCYMAALKSLAETFDEVMRGDIR